MIIEGSVAPGFESVRSLYEERMQRLAERNTQLCVYVAGERVIDLWGSAIDDQRFGPDALVNVFSSGKSLESLLLGKLLERGLLEFDAPIATYWPDYAVNGKDSTRVADLMRHEAGLSSFDTTLAAGDLRAEALKEDTVGRVIARQTPRYRRGPDERREYHAITRGWVANELFRRLEPGGRTMAECLREDISEPLGADVYITLRDDELERLSPVQPLGWGYQVAQGLLPRAFGRKMERNLWQTAARVRILGKALRGTSRRKPPPAIEGIDRAGFFNSREAAAAEIPSAGAKCSARGLARLAAAMAAGGELAGVRLFSAETHQALHSGVEERDMLVSRTAFSQAGLATFAAPRPEDTTMDRALNRGREGYFGWMGLGGSIFQWHPELDIGFAYVPTSLNVLDVVNERGKTYQAEVVRCVQQISGRA